jgi:hypothetical protein
LIGDELISTIFENIQQMLSTKKTKGFEN